MKMFNLSKNFKMLPVLLSSFALAHCGSYEKDQSQVKKWDSPFENLDFAAWCESWDLVCPNGREDEGPTTTMPEWKAGFDITKSFLSGRTEFVFDKTALVDENIQRAAEFLGARDFLDSFVTKMSEFGFNNLNTRNGDGAVNFGFAENSIIESNAGLKFYPATESSILPNVDASIAVDGLNISNTEASKRDTFENIELAGNGELTWKGNEFTVTGVKQSFMPSQLNIPVEKLPEEVKGLQYLDAFGPTLNWFLTTESHIVLDQNFMSTLHSYVDTFVDDPRVNKIFKSLTQTITLVESDNIDDTDHVLDLQLTAKHALKCQMGKKKKFIFAKDFGLETVSVEANGKVKLDFYGIRIRAKKGIFTKTFDLNKVTIDGHKVILHDVPIYGDYVIDYDKPSEDPAMTCSAS